MARLALPIEGLQPHYEVVVIGSGYGGAIAASRLARAGRQVCLLERGKEFISGEFPETEVEALREMQMHLPDKHIGSRTGLYDFHLHRDINVFVGCGLGGTSLVNANVSLQADARVFDDPKWPRELRDDAGGKLAEGYRKAELMLRPAVYPKSFPKLDKMEALKQSAAALGGTFRHTPINVNFEKLENGMNHVGVEQQPCVVCGDCVSGCNHGAKNTMMMNYLPDARKFGAEIYTQVSVQYIEKSEKGNYRVYYQLLGTGRERFNAQPLFVSADFVVIAAGTLGTTEILLRSKDKGLPLSDQLGERFTGNGDVLGFGYNNESIINGIGYGVRDKSGLNPVGPCITGVIDMRQTERLEDGMVLEEGSIPGSLASILPGMLSVTAQACGEESDVDTNTLIDRKERELKSLVQGPYAGAIQHTQTYLVMAHDDGNGRMKLENDKLVIEWKGVGNQPAFNAIHSNLQKATEANGGVFVKNPIWNKHFNHRLITVHPLGGCCMSESAEHGVVNHKGQLFAGVNGDQVHDGLYVCDGSIIPRPLGVNPLLTISALAERCCSVLAEERGWTIDYSFQKCAPAPETVQELGIQFTETMRGYFSINEKEDFSKGYKLGKTGSSPYKCTLTIKTDHLEHMLKNKDHKAPIVGTVTAPALSNEPLTVSDGWFQLLVDDPQRPETREMRYRMKLYSVEGNIYYFTGYKSIHQDHQLDLWSDTTTLYITIFQGEDASAPVLGKGMLHIHPDDFLKQMTTMQVLHNRTKEEQMEALAKFGKFFAGSLFDVYGGIFASQNVFNPKAPPRKKRVLRAGSPEVYPVKTKDGFVLRLLRYKGGEKGPVMLSHGLGVSSAIYSLDTIDTNLLEYLYAYEYDVWLLDFRASIELPVSKEQWSGDDVAKYDYPAAVERIREVTGAPSIQVVAHCVGSTTLMMALLAGLTGVRSAVCSQVAAHMKAPLMTKLKTGLYMPTFLKKLGIRSLNAYVDSNASWVDKLFNQALKLYPMEFEEWCSSPVCHRITFMYGSLYEHDQLNTATHQTLHETFGIGNMTMFEHLALLVREGSLRSYNGDDIYLSHADRLAIPITFISGAENQCFLPESTELTYKFLQKRFGPDNYCRHVIPNYGHIDCIMGKNAVNDVYPYILEHLEGIGK